MTTHDVLIQTASVTWQDDLPVHCHTSSVNHSFAAKTLSQKCNHRK